VALALWNLGRAAALWRQADWLTGLPIRPDSRVRLAAALGWAALFLLASAGLWRRRDWARRLVPLLLTLYGLYELGMIVLVTSTSPATLPILAYAAFVGFAGWALWRPSAGPLFHPRHKGGR
jgi:hypothetical protein